MRTISFCLAMEIGKRKETVFALRKILIDSASFLFSFLQECTEPNILRDWDDKNDENL